MTDLFLDHPTAEFVIMFSWRNVANGGLLSSSIVCQDKDKLMEEFNRCISSSFYFKIEVLRNENILQLIQDNIAPDTVRQLDYKGYEQ